jgi:hypothetical protein
MKTYIYLKTHLETGLKYLGKTVQDPFIYNGSGTIWNRHLKKYGNNVKTEILFESTDKKEIAEKGLYYSTLWNIVESKEFANMRPETGDGGDTSNTENYKKGIQKRNLSGKHNPMYGRSAVSEKNLKWYNDGIRTIYVSEGTQPEGFQPGRIIKNRISPTDYTKQLIGKANSKKIISPEGIIYNSLKEASDMLGVTSVAIGGRLKRGVSGWKYLK